MGQAINCGESGRDFLSDPEHDFGRILNPNVLSLEQLLDKPCLVLCGEPGMGKSKAIELARQEIIAPPGADQNPLWINFRDIPTEQVFRRKTFETAKWKAWLESDSKLTLVVDGIDEGLIRVPNFIPYLTEELRGLPLLRLQVILVCRTAEWSLAAGNQLLGLWNVPDDNAVFELCPLRDRDARLAAQEWNLDADKFMLEVYTQNVSGLAARPTTLFFLLREFSAHGTFPGTHFDLYDSGCKRLCDEHDSKRLAAFHYQQPAPNPFSPAEVHKMATRMAVLLMVCGKSAVYVGDKAAAEPTDLLVEQIIDAPAEKHLVYAALSTALFSARGPDRFGFAHQTFAECLAAQGLRSLPLIQVRSALCQRDGHVEHVVPQLAETAAWLAAMRDDFLEFIIAREPEVLLRSDVTRIQARHKEQLVTALLERAKREEAFDEWDMRRFYSGLKHPGLAKQLWPYANDSTLNFEARHLRISKAKIR